MQDLDLSQDINDVLPNRNTTQDINMTSVTIDVDDLPDDEDKVRTLMLVGEQEKSIIPADILLENVTVRVEGSVKDELLIQSYDTIIITKSFATAHGDNLTKKIIKMMHTLTQAKIHYFMDFNWNKGFDSIGIYLRGLGIDNIGRINLETLSLKTFRDIVRTDNEIVPVKSRREFAVRDLNIMRQELQSLLDSMATDYINRNREELIDLITSYLQIASEREDMQDQIQSLTVEKYNYKQMSEDYFAKMRTLEIQNKTMRTDMLELRKNFLTEKDKLIEYNKIVTNNKLIDNPEVQFDIASPIVLYFKELEDIGFFQFYQAILYTLKEVYKLSVKSVVLEPQARSFYDPYSELGYITVPDEVKMDVIIDNDQIVRFGNPTTLLQTISRPQFKLDIILIYDRVGSDNLLIKSPNIIPFYLGHKMSRVKTLTLDPISWISPNEGEYRTVKPLMNQEQTNDMDNITYMSLVSKHPLTRYILDLILD